MNHDKPHPPAGGVIGRTIVAARPVRELDDGTLLIVARNHEVDRLGELYQLKPGARRWELILPIE